MRRERVDNSNISPGFTFQLEDEPGVFKPGVFMVLTMIWKQKLDGSHRWEYDCLTPQMRIETFYYLGEVFVIADPRRNR